MMHTTEGSKYRFCHHGDYSGDVKVINMETGTEIEVPFDDMKLLVASWVRDKTIARLEQAEADALLLPNAEHQARCQASPECSCSVEVDHAD